MGVKLKNKRSKRRKEKDQFGVRIASGNYHIKKGSRLGCGYASHFGDAEDIFGWKIHGWQHQVTC